MKVVTIMPNNWLAERMDELIRAVDEIFVGKIPSVDDLLCIHQVLVERRDAELDRQSVTDEAVQRAIEWLEAEKESVQTDFERSDADWRMEYGVKETHDERMAAFDLAIQALRQMEIDLYPKAGLDPDAGDWGNGYSRGYADGLQARQMRSEPCEWCDITGDWIYEVAVIRNRRKTHKGEMKNYCPNCGRKLVK